MNLDRANSLRFITVRLRGIVRINPNKGGFIMSYLDKEIANENFSPELREILRALVKEIDSLKIRLSGLEQKVAQVQGASRSGPDAQ